MPEAYLRSARRAHLIGIAGAGMRSLAEVLVGWGWQLSGSDLAAESVPALAAKGISVRKGHAAGHVPPETELVVYSDAIPAQNPELRRARRQGIPTLSYFELLGRIMAGRHGLAVAGTHGKSTTAAMAEELLVRAGLDPMVVYGATPLGRDSGGRPGRGDRMLVEACEYRANFLLLPARHAVILGIEPDHFDCYPSFDRLEHAFRRFARSLPSDGLLLARSGCPATRRAVAGASCRVETFGLDPNAAWSARGLRARGGRYRFGIFRHGQAIAEAALRVPGRHNVLNALAAAALAWHEGVGPDQIGAALGRFGGIARRLEVLGSWRGVVVVDDYAHHPTEIAATLSTTRQMYPGRRIWCLFQPHQVSRTERLLDELASSLHNADRVVVAEVFRAREPGPVPGEVTAADLARKIRALGGDAREAGPDERIAQGLEARLRPGDLLITMGAGDIRKVTHELIQRFREDRAAG
jgi:UDP-N-acetylmuramate--alanine ligase